MKADWHTLHLIALAILTGTLFALRALFIPAQRQIAPEEATRLMGKLMPRARRVLRLSLLIALATGLIESWRQRAALDAMGAAWALRLILALALASTVLLIAIPPDYRIAPRLLPHRDRLLTLAFLLALVLFFF
jgi:hypothetical protein